MYTSISTHIPVLVRYLTNLHLDSPQTAPGILIAAVSQTKSAAPVLPSGRGYSQQNMLPLTDAGSQGHTAHKNIHTTSIQTFPFKNIIKGR